VEVEIFPEESEDQSDEMHSCRNVSQQAAKLMVKVA
jgi:hypothetical protein